MPLFTETYTFYTTSDDGARLWVNGTMLINKWVNQSSTEWPGTTINLTRCQKYDIVMEYYENSGSAVAQLRWSSASQAKQIIPQAVLFSNLGTVSTATITRTPTITLTRTITQTRTITRTPTVTRTRTLTLIPSRTYTRTLTTVPPTRTRTPTPTDTPTFTPTFTNTSTRTVTPTFTETNLPPTVTNTSNIPTRTPTVTKTRVGGG